VSQAQSALDQAKTPPTDDAKLAAAEAVESAGSALASASANLQRLRAGAANADVAAAQSAVSAADAAYAAAKARLDTLKIGGAPGDKETSAAQVAQAKAALELRKSGPVKTDLDVLDAQAKLAETALAQAKASRRSATIVSPIAGVVVSTSGNIGETIVASTAVVVVADLTTLRVETTDLDEAGAAMLKTGMPTKIRINAFTDKELTGKVDEIASVATTTASGDANYVVIITLDQPDPSLKIGMTARVEFPVGR
jgi:multidrug efflux pump subunit AcrA (membrane-fusion protein)